MSQVAGMTRERSNPVVGDFRGENVHEGVDRDHIEFDDGSVIDFDYDYATETWVMHRTGLLASPYAIRGFDRWIPLPL